MAICAGSAIEISLLIGTANSFPVGVAGAFFADVAT
jgi:hypothetical protein